MYLLLTDTFTPKYALVINRENSREKKKMIETVPFIHRGDVNVNDQISCQASTNSTQLAITVKYITQ